MMILFIGDPHIKNDNHFDIDQLLTHLCILCKEHFPDRIIIGGDLMHFHERIFTQALNKTLSFITTLSSFAPVEIMVGNHDMINNQQFLTSHHWMNVLSKLTNITVTDKPRRQQMGRFTYITCPYVYPGRFIEALETIGTDWKSVDMIFAHQEFKGCKMGAMISTIGDEWEGEWPPIISGHIHDNQRVGTNIYYPGAPLQHAFGDTSTRVVCIINETGKITDIPLNVPKKIIVKSSIDNVITSIGKVDSTVSVKLKLSATVEEFKLFKQTKQYQDCINKGVKIQLEEIKTLSHQTTQTSFLSILDECIKKDGDVLLKKICNEILQ